MNIRSFQKQLSHYSKRIQIIGIKKSCVIAYNKLQKKYNFYFLRKRAYSQGNFTWKELCKKERGVLTFHTFFSTTKNYDFLKQFEANLLWKRYLPNVFKDTSFIIAEANKILTNTFTILGYTKTFSDTIPWHTDIKNSYTYDASLFYEDIQPTFKQAISFEEYFPDIKVPWELSRMNHLYVLGKAYTLTDDEKYARYFQEHINDWITKNPFLLGVNWVCPMDVGLRALNLVWGWHFFKNSPSITLEFWERFTCSLYGHAYYLEHNWENSIPTSNHYLSDLIGYFYLCFFFNHFPSFGKKKNWCFKELLQECDLQIQSDGTSYEGSTHYHILVTEIFLHFYTIATTHAMALPEKLISTLKRMLQFIDDYSDHAGNIPWIGDMDGGKVVTGLQPQKKIHSSFHVTEYKDFGLTLIQDSRWHISFRSHAYKLQQPSGHFHNDTLSVTVSFDGIPILVDPGTYLYTSNSHWRNYLRSAQNHNAAHVNNDNEFSMALFQLPLEPLQIEPIIVRNENSIEITNQRKLGKRIYNRTLMFNQHELVLKDTFEEDRLFDSLKWSFIFHPSIKLISRTPHEWEVTYNDKKIVTFYTSLGLYQEINYYSPTYGTIQQCTMLTNTMKIFSETPCFRLFT